MLNVISHVTESLPHPAATTTLMIIIITIVREKKCPGTNAYVSNNRWPPMTRRPLRQSLRRPPPSSLPVGPVQVHTPNANSLADVFISN